jgi:methyl-accepting chemotaxis protein
MKPAPNAIAVQRSRSRALVASPFHSNPLPFHIDPLPPHIDPGLEILRCNNLRPSPSVKYATPEPILGVLPDFTRPSDQQDLSMPFNPFASRKTSARMVELEAMAAAISKAQAVIEFNLDGTVITANDNFLKTLGYTLEEIRGKPHSLFVDAAFGGSEDYRRFWERLRAGKYEAARYKRIGKGGREVWIQASYNPLIGGDGRPYKVVKFATDITAELEASRSLDAAVAETQAVVQGVIDGASDRRISVAGKSGQLGVLAASVNSLIEGVLSVSGEVGSCVQGAIDGDLKRRVSVDDKAGHFKTLSMAVNDLIANMMDVVQGLQKTSREVQTGAEEISRGNIDLSRRTEQQASSLEETASSMEQMTASVKNNADNAAQANQLASAAREQAERGGLVVGSAVAAMSEINSASKKIADIIGVIDEIAFQTNLLALNAAVEAARAGEQGRGFAVVASEVRNLASRSAQAAKEIKALIQDSVGKVTEGSKLVDESGRVLGEIVMGVKKVTDVVAEIAASSREQASGIDQVNKAMTAMDATTQQNSALVEQASAAAQALTEQATNLSHVVAKYDVGADTAFGRVERAAPAARKDGATAAAGERRAATRPWSAKSKSTAPAPAAAPKAAAAAGDGDQWTDF